LLPIKVDTLPRARRVNTPNPESESEAMFRVRNQQLATLADPFAGKNLADQLTALGFEVTVLHEANRAQITEG